MIQKDPPPIKTQTREIRRIRIGFLANLGFSPVPSSLVTFMAGPGAITSFRITRIALYATDDQIAGTAGTSSFGVTLGLPGIQQTGVASSIALGDGAVYTDVGTTGQQRAQVHVIPSREFCDHWWLSTDSASVPLTASSVPLAPAASTSLNILDITVEMLFTP
jgi:hypothetical protein